MRALFDAVGPAAEAALSCSLLDHFAKDSARVDALSVTVGPFFADFSKTHLDPGLIAAAAGWWQGSDAAVWLESVRRGGLANSTERRAALHEAWRAAYPPATVAAHVAEVNHAMQALVADWRASDATALVHIGIGGSSLGPELALTALAPHGGRFDVRVVGNLDASATLRALQGLDPQRTRVIVASKSWTTLETQTNMTMVHAWLRAGGVACPESVTAALTGRGDLARAAGISSARIFDVPDWVGGRFSLWSAIGLPIALQLGWDGFQRLRQGAALMDSHAAETPLARNAPWLAALAGWLYACIAGCGSRATFAYDDRLRMLPAHLSQLEMESLGKSVTRDGAPVACGIGAMWGGVGTDVQHAVIQAVQQGHRTVPVDFVAVQQCGHDHADRHRLVLASMLGQAAMMLRGKNADAVRAEMSAAGHAPEDIEELVPHKSCPGNRPSTTILLDRLTPEALGALIAFYEQRTVMLAAFLGVNPFDQWGVEMGKAAALRLAHGQASGVFDPSTAALAARLLHPGT